MTTSFEWGPELPRLRGARLELRHLVPEDAPAILAVFGDPEVMRYWSSPPLADLAAAAKLIDDIRRGFDSREFLQWGIGSLDTGEILGTCTLFRLDRAHRRSEIGYALARSAWGRGLATEAVELMIGFAFGPLDLHRLEADTDPKNERSLRLLERQGFRREGYLRERWHHLGEIQDAIFLGLLRPEWTKTGA